jgi:hypothetical protein
MFERAKTVHALYRAAIVIDISSYRIYKIIKCVTFMVGLIYDTKCFPGGCTGTQGAAACIQKQRSLLDLLSLIVATVTVAWGRCVLSLRLSMTRGGLDIFHMKQITTTQH